MFKFYIK